MTVQQSLVSVVIATYRRPSVIGRAVGCVLAQTVDDLEIVVVIERDDHDTASALAGVDDPRLRIVINPHKAGPAAARDFGIRQAHGTWIAFLDDDDEWLPEKLERQIAAAPDGHCIVMTLTRVLTPSGELIHPTRPYEGHEPIDEWLFGRRTWLKGGEAMLQTSSLMVPKALFDRIGFGEARHEEWELAIRAVKQFGYRLITVREPLVIYRAGNTYPWRPSAVWIDSVRDLVSPRAYAGFCLTTATQGLVGPERNRAALTFLGKALRHGRPTPKQFFAFVLIWLVPETLRHRLRTTLARRAR